MINIEDKLRKRYGQARFNPAEGQADMTYREWLDRHPALTSNKAVAQRYLQATGKTHPTLNPNAMSSPNKTLKDFAGPIAAPASQAPRPMGGLQAGASRMGQMGGPDKPPAERAKSSAKRKSEKK